jgi:hypothetical protein
MAKKFADDAQRVIDLVEATGITRRRSVLLLVFSRAKPDVAGYLNANPYDAARAMVEFLLQKYPDAKRPGWLRHTTSRRSKRQQARGTSRGP